MSSLPDPALFAQSRPLAFGVAWESPGHQFGSSLRAFFTGPKPPKVGAFSGGPELTIYWVRGKLSGRAFLASSLWHIAAVLIMLLPIWGFLPRTTPTLAPVRIELSWYGTPPDLPTLSLPGPAAKPKPVAERPKPVQRGADAYHPRQTILSLPAHATHPRQTLIQPNASPAPPKILPQLPNIAEWAATTSLPRLKLPLAPNTSAPRVRHREINSVAAPEVAKLEKDLGPLNIASSSAAVSQPQMPIAPMSAPIANQKAPAQEIAAPELSAAESAGDASLHRLIALSANPAPPAPEVTVPEGNLSAHLSISPEGTQPGIPGGLEHGDAGGGSPGNTVSVAGVGANGNAPPGNGGGGNTKSLPGGVSISGGTNGHSAGGGVAPSGSRAGGGLVLNRPSIGVHAEPLTASHRTTPRTPGNIDRSLPPEKILSDKQVYTLYVNMPNMTSVSGSWVLNFAQLDDGASPPYIKKPDLSGPVLLRKVDPKYPQSFVEAHVDGEVVLYAIIRKDGSVDSIQLVHSLDPQLDMNSMDALARWQFTPATRQGLPVELEAVVHIPFHFRPSPNY
jgi:TonB family protein